MSRGRRQVLQLNEPTPRVLYSNEPTNEMEDDDDDSAGDMPTPERLVTEDMLPNRPGPTIGPGGRFEMDNKVANFLAEIDALDPGLEGETSASPVLVGNQVPSPVQEQHFTPPREKSPVRSKPNAYSNMFVKGTPEFVKKPDDLQNSKSAKKLEAWPEEPKTDWQQLTDEKTNYPYYWNMVTNAVVWDMPAEFSQYLLRQKEYEEKVERGLREGTLDPEQRIKKSDVPAKQDEKKVEEKLEEKTEVIKESERPSRSKHSRRGSHSEDSSSDSSDSDGSQPRNSQGSTHKTKPDNPPEVSSSSAESSRAASHDKAKRSATPELPDSTKPDEKKISSSKHENNDDSIDFDVDDIDKELEMALERKRQELMKLEDKKTDSKSEKDKSSSKDRKKDEHRYHDEDRREDRHRRHGKHRESDRDRDRERERERDRKYHDREEKKPKLTLKERLRIEMELKMEKERRKKRAIEDMMARELEQAVGRGGGPQKRSRDEKPSKRYRLDDDRGDYRSREEYGEYSRDYNTWDGRETSSSYDDRFIPPSHMKAPPPTDEMLAYEEERKSKVVDYGHGRSSRLYDLNGDSDTEEIRSADAREMEMKKLESLQLAELALSKLEFLEVTKKGLSKLQILLVELETRHQDWQAGGLTTNHFLGKLKEANWQLEQYEASAAPTGWACSWDRDYRRYFYTHKLTGKNQWDYPDADDIRVENERANDPKKKFVRGKEVEAEISSTSDKGKGGLDKEILASMALPPPPPPPAEEHPSVKSLQLMYGSSSESETEEPSSKKSKKEVVEKSDLNSVPLPPIESHKEKEKEKEKKDKHHKKKKKKEKSKKKEREKSEAGVIGPVVPTGSIYPHFAAQPPPPPSGEASDAVVADPYNTTPAEAYMTSGGPSHQVPEVPVYGAADDAQAGLNDQPLEFGSVQEPSGPHPYAEDMDTTESGVISHGPQMVTVSHQPETYSSMPTEPISEATMGDVYAESSTGAVPNTEEKKKKKKEKMGTGSISLKKKHVSSMVQKWQKVKKEVELEEQTRQIREAEIRRKLAELE